MTEEKQNLESILKNLPKNPGVYLMKDAAGEIIYIGKANSLKQRVSSYFQKTKQDYKTSILREHIADIDVIITDTEIEALILESNLVKKNQPKYNVRLKDDKRYPYITITLKEPYPRVLFTRDTRRKGARYFGPYTDAAAARRLVTLINTIFKLKTCNKELPLKKDERPCLNYQMKRCSGICIGTITQDEYINLVENAIHFLEGKIDPVLHNLQSIMKTYSKNFEYEKAGQMRDIIYDIQKLSQEQRVYIPIKTNQDYIAHKIFDTEAIVVLFEFRKGVLIGSKISIMDNVSLSEPEEIIRTFLVDYYERNERPQQIVTEVPIRDRTILEDYFTSKSSKNIAIRQPESGDDTAIIKLIKKNIDAIAIERTSRRQKETIQKGLLDLQAVLHLEEMPSVIECYDISNLQGKDAVASMVFFRDGLPEKSQYRRFRIRGYDTPNDPAMIHEVVSRRLQYISNEEVSPPDLMVIDGGKGQLSRAQEAAANFDIPVTIISIAKREEEIFYDPKKSPVVLSKKSPALHIIQNARDEAHRFAITYHRKLRDKKTTRSILDDIPDIGEKTKMLLLNHFSSVEAVKTADLEELKSVQGVGDKTAKKIFLFFHNAED